MKPRFLSSLRLSFPLAAAISALLSTHSAKAVAHYWDNNTTTTGFGNAGGTWGTSAFWTLTAGGGAPHSGVTLISTSDQANFGTDSAGLGGGTINVNGTVNAASLRFGSATTGSVTLSGGTINLAAATSIHVGAGSTTVHTIASAITGATTSLTKTGNTLRFSGSNSYTGSTNITSGTLILNNAGALGGSTPGVNGTSGVSMVANTTLRADLGITTAAPITLSGVGNVTIANGTTTAVTAIYNGGITGTTNTLTFSIGNNNSNPAHVIRLGATSNYAGNTTITTGGTSQNLTVQSGATNALPTTTILTMDGGSGSGSGRTISFDLNGNNQTLAGLNTLVGYSAYTARNQRVSSTAPATLTINGSVNSSYGGVGTSSTFSGNAVNPTATITGAISLVKDGTGTFTLGPVGMGFNGSTTILGGILSLSHSNNIQNSAFDTAGSILGDPNNGLRTTVTTLTLGGLTGNKNFADVFTTTIGGYDGLTALTLNPSANVTTTYSADIGNGAGALNLIKTGAGTHILAAPQTYTGTTTGSVGALVATTTAALPGYNVAGKIIFNGGTIGVQVGGGGWATGDVDTLLVNATKTSGALGIDTTNGNLTQWTPFTTTNFGSLGLNKLGANDLTLDQVNTYTGQTTVTAGTLTLTNALALQNSRLVTTGAGTVVLSGVTTLNLGALSGASGDLATVITGYAGVTAITLNTPAGLYLTYGGNIADGSAPTTLTKTGAGTQVFTGTNSYTGATQIDGGILVFGNKVSKSAGSAVTASASGIIGLGVKAADAAFYSAAEVGDLFNTNSLAGFTLDAASGVAIDTTLAAAAFDQTVALTAARSLTKVGTGTLILSTANSYTGATNVNSGILSITNSDSLGTAAGATTITGASGNTSLVLTSATTDLIVADNLNFNGTVAGRARLENNSAQNHGFSGGINVSSDTQIVEFSSSGAGSVAFSGDITGTFTNGASLLLRGTSLSSSNVITGNINLIGGPLYKSDAGTWTVGAAGKTINASHLQVAIGTLKMGEANVLLSAPEVIMGQSTGSSNGIVDLNGFSQTIGGISFSGTAGSKSITSSTGTPVLTVNAASDFTTGNLVALTGSLSLIKDGVGTQTLAGVNTYSGDTIVNAGTLALADNAQLKFILGASSGVNNSISGAGTATLDGDFVIDTSAADALTTGTWTLENVTGGSYSSTFSLVGFVDAGDNKWTKANGPTKRYTFDEATGVLTLGPAGNYESWANDPLKGNIPGELAADDFDKDGITNLMEYALGQNPRVSSQPAGVLVDNVITYTKGADAIANGDVSWVIETSQTLLADSWTAQVTQAPANPALTISYTFTPGTPEKNFARLKVTQVP